VAGRTNNPSGSLGYVSSDLYSALGSFICEGGAISSINGKNELFGIDIILGSLRQ
jgi:hypothetical protein